MFRFRALIVGMMLFLFSSLCVAKVIETTRLVGFGEAKYPVNFQHFDYVNPDAPKSGMVVMGETGTFDNFNAYASRGVAAASSDMLYDTLMTASSDEVAAYYPLIAEKVRYSDDYTWLEIDINPHARFHDGKPITAHDVEFTFNKFMQEGIPQYRVYYKDIKFVKALNDKTVRVEMSVPDRHKLLDFAETTTVLPEHFWKDKKLNEPLMVPPLGSGPYKIVAYKMGQSVTYKLVDNYWAKDLPVNVGRNNFRRMRFDYYRDDSVMFEAFKAGEFGFRLEYIAKRWATGYTGTNIDKGYIVKENILHTKPANAQGFVFNTLNSKFANPKVREAFNYAMDFEWMNKTLFYGQYTRTRSYFQNTIYEAKGLPSAAEKVILQPFKSELPPRVFSEEYQPPVTDGSGHIRNHLRKAFALLKDAGWEVKNQVMTNIQTGQPFVFEFLVSSPTMERVALIYQRNLKRLGITMNIRMVDTTQFIKHMRDKDYEMISAVYPANKFPNGDLALFWNSRYQDSSYNRAGVSNPVVDYLTDQITKNQRNEDKLIELGRALDRVLQWNFYMVPHWYLSTYRVAYWDKFERPAVMPKYDLGLDTWWISKEKASKLPKKRQ